jgi:hypothetical protein
LGYITQKNIFGHGFIIFSKQKQIKTGNKSNIRQVEGVASWEIMVILKRRERKKIFM